MNKLFYLFLCILPFVSIHAQENAADFDGTTGYISVEQASAFISPDGMTIEAWVFPRNEAPGWPDFDGLFGLRNESNCDFYLLQLGASTIEARFRNSDGQDYTLTNAGLVVNEWNHLALTYGDNFLTFYLNGQFQQVIAAEGVCGDMEVPFTMGKTNFDGANDFYFDGLLDDVRVWSESRTEEQIEQYYNCKIQNPEDFPTLTFYYDLDETTGATIVTDNGDTGINGDVIEGVTFTESTVDYKIVDRLKTTENILLKVYPNPTPGNITIELLDNKLKDLYLINVLGQKISLDITKIVNNQIHVIDLKPGMYQLFYSNNSASGSSKFLVLN